MYYEGYFWVRKKGMDGWIIMYSWGDNDGWSFGPLDSPHTSTSDLADINHRAINPPIWPSIKKWIGRFVK